MIPHFPFIIPLHFFVKIKITVRCFLIKTLMKDKKNTRISGNRSMTRNARTLAFCTSSIGEVKSNKLDDMPQ